MVDFPSALLTKKQFLLSELQTHGLRLLDASAGAASRRGGAGPTDHKAVTVLGTTIMVPVHTRGAAKSTYVATPPDARGFRPAKRRRGGLRDFLSAAAAILRADDRGRHSLLEDRAAPLARHARDHRAANLHPLRQQRDEMPVLRDRRIAQSRTNHRQENREQLAEVAAAAQRLDGIATWS